ncbi:hypothetical protein [Porticoccus hydrocarbonoclasticus]|uniref:hypothetical protein n=1 Tax=Porticoccus hydrocarbonoclasticus TaxID=1073414 RepID=UPI001362F5E9|nr:hypothetical protein [Porticoccus hydrocarbonoclasticus]
MKARYLVEVETVIVTPSIIEATCDDEAIKHVMQDDGQPWYGQAGNPRVKALGEISHE